VIPFVALVAVLVQATAPPQPAAATVQAPALQAPTVQAVPFDTVLEARTTEVARGLRCPVCQGVSINDSPAELAQQLRAVVREQLAAGKSEDEVRAYFVARYGEWVLLAPEPKGFNLLAYAIPALLLAGGALGVAVLVKRWTAPQPAA
jgi:cytochrome c-type biogenesis protein CcmH